LLSDDWNGGSGQCSQGEAGRLEAPDEEEFRDIHEGRFRQKRAISGIAFKRRGKFRVEEAKVNVAGMLIQGSQKGVRSKI